MKHLSNFKFMAMALFVAMLSLSFTACSDDDDDPKEGNNSIVGTWERETTLYGNNGSFDATVRLVFKSGQKGTATIIYKNGWDPEDFNFQYIYREESGYATVEFIWTGSTTVLYDTGVEYDVSITPDRLIIDGDVYVRK